MLGQLGYRYSLALPQRQGALLQDVPPRRAQLTVDYLPDQLLRALVAARLVFPPFLLAQHPAPQRLLQGLHARPHPQLG
ncbi:MAG TPA: hypothetical protein VF026_00185, partial [Ktedonobacteraceae bacterium]